MFVSGSYGGWRPRVACLLLNPATGILGITSHELTEMLLERRVVDLHALREDQLKLVRTSGSNDRGHITVDAE